MLVILGAYQKASLRAYRGWNGKGQTRVWEAGVPARGMR